MKNIDEKYNVFIKTLSTTNIKLEEYTSWKKINKEMDKNRWYCNQLNFFLSINEKDFKLKFSKYFNESEESFKMLPLLLSNKKEHFNYLINNQIRTFNIKNKSDVYIFIRESGLLENIFINESCKDIYSYCFGVEVGIDNNSLKNKSGKWASDILLKILEDNNIEEIKKEVYIKDILNLPNNKLGEFQNKKFDFVFKYKNVTYLVELNYFNSGGSKINSESDRFIELNNKIIESKIPNIKLLYVTDGLGWLKHKEKLKMVLKNIGHCYNFQLLKSDFFKN